VNLDYPSSATAPPKPFLTANESRTGLGDTNSPNLLAFRTEPSSKRSQHRHSVAGELAGFASTTNRRRATNDHESGWARGRKTESSRFGQTSVVMESPLTSNPLAANSFGGCQRTDAVPDQRRRTIKPRQPHTNYVRRYIDDSGIGKNAWVSLPSVPSYDWPHYAREHGADIRYIQAMLGHAKLHHNGESTPRSPIRKAASNPRTDPPCRPRPRRTRPHDLKATGDAGN